MTDQRGISAADVVAARPDMRVDLSSVEPSPGGDGAATPPVDRDHGQARGSRGPAVPDLSPPGEGLTTERRERVGPEAGANGKALLCDYWMPDKSKCPEIATVRAEDQFGAPLRFCLSHWAMSDHLLAQYGPGVRIRRERVDTADSADVLGRALG
jgi:hypothetical protein